MWNHPAGKVNYLVRRQTVAGWEIRDRCIRDYELVLVLRGQGCVRIAGTETMVRSGDLILIRPGIAHCLWVTQPPYFAFYAMHFDVPKDELPLPFPDVQHLDAPLRLERLFKQLHEVYLEKGYLYLWRQTLLLQQILCEIMTIRHEKTAPMGTLRVRRVLAYIHENPCRKISLDDLLEQAGMGKTAFLDAFRTVTGTTPLQYIIGQRLENARDFLENTDLPISQIARECGFSDPLYFSRCFRRHFAASPTQYRRALRSRR